MGMAGRLATAVESSSTAELCEFRDWFTSLSRDIRYTARILKADEVWPDAASATLGLLAETLAEGQKHRSRLDDVTGSVFCSYVERLAQAVSEMEAAVGAGERNLRRHDATGRLLDAINNSQPLFEMLYGVVHEAARRRESASHGQTPLAAKHGKSRPERTQPWQERQDDADLYQKWQSFCSAATGRPLHRDFVQTLNPEISDKDSSRRVRAFREWLKALAEEYRVKTESESEAAFARRRAKGMTAKDLRRLLAMAAKEGF
jgi:hypothetical protein